jgi:hypothetical protein
MGKENISKREAVQHGNTSFNGGVITCILAGKPFFFWLSPVITAIGWHLPEPIW